MHRTMDVVYFVQGKQDAASYMVRALQMSNQGIHIRLDRLGSGGAGAGLPGKQGKQPLPPAGNIGHSLPGHTVYVDIGELLVLHHSGSNLKIDDDRQMIASHSGNGQPAATALNLVQVAAKKDLIQAAGR